MPSALFLSPHLDDVAFSCGATLHRLARTGWRATLCTVLTRSVPNPSGFALACQLDKGLGPDVDYMALRRAEDAEAARRLDAEPLWLDLPEAPHRGYDSAPALFGPYTPPDSIAPALEQALRPLLAASRFDLTFAPQGIGRHVDHRRVRAAVLALADPAAVAWYRDTPYAIRHPDARADPGLPAATELALPVAEADLAAKLDACAAYASQLGFQFGGEAEARVTLAAFARAEAVRLDAPWPLAESVLVPPALAPILRP